MESKNDFSQSEKSFLLYMFIKKNDKVRYVLKNHFFESFYEIFASSR